MIKRGQAYNSVLLNVDLKLAKDISDEIKKEVTEHNLRELADICLANGWISRTTLGLYSNLQITLSGMGVINSKRKQQDATDKKGALKKSSEYIDEHKGIFILLGFLGTIIGLIMNYYKR